MTKVELQTGTGEHVTFSRVPYVKSLPEVLIWGQRVFAAHSVGLNFAIYREAFTHYITELRS